MFDIRAAAPGRLRQYYHLFHVGTTLVTAQRNKYPWFGRSKEEGPAPGKRSEIPSSLEARNFIRGETFRKRVNRLGYDEER